MKEKTKVIWALIALATTFFGTGITEFIGVGVLPEIQQEFGVTAAQASMIVSIYALGQAVGGVLLTAATTRFARKRVLLGAIVLFIIGHILTAMAPTFSLLLTSRVLSAAAHGLFFSLASAVAVSLVAPEKAASAVAFIFSGFTIATAFAAPLGTYISTFTGWRIPFFGIAAVGVIALLVNQLALPKHIKTSATKPSMHDQLRLITTPHVLLMMTVTILGYGSTFAAFTYLSLLLTQVTGIASSTVSAVLVVYGITVGIGNTLGGKFGNASQLPALLKIFTVQGVVFLALYFALPQTIPALIMVAIMGLMAFMSIPSLQSYMLIVAKRHVPAAIDFASSLNIASFSGGITVGATFGGFFLEAFGLQSVALAATFMVFAAVGLTFVSLRMEQTSCAEDKVRDILAGCEE